MECIEKSSGDKVAMKIISKKKLKSIKGAEEKLKTEIKIHKSLDHPKIVKFYSHFEDNKYHYLVLELCSDKVNKRLTNKYRILNRF